METNAVDNNVVETKQEQSAPRFEGPFIEVNKDAEDKKVKLILPQNISIADVKGSVMAIFEHFVRFEYDKFREFQAKTALETEKAEEPKVEVVKE